MVFEHSRDDEDPFASTSSQQDSSGTGIPSPTWETDLETALDSDDSTLRSEGVCLSLSLFPGGLTPSSQFLELTPVTSEEDYSSDSDPLPPTVKAQGVAAEKETHMDETRELFSFL